MFKKSLAILLLFFTPSLIGCTKHKEDLSSIDGQYFVKSLGSMVDKKDFKQNIPFKNTSASKGNYDYRNGSLEAKLSGLQKYRINGAWNQDIKIFSTPTFIKNGFVSVNDKGAIHFIEGEKNLKLITQFFSKPNLCSNLSSDFKDDILVVSCGTNILSGFDLTNGKKLWSIELDMSIGSKPLITEDGIVIIFSKSDSVYSIDLKSGELLWLVPSIVKTQNKNISETKPILFNQYIIQQTADDQIRAINIVSGSIDWISSISNTREYVKGKDFTNEYSNIALDPKDESIYLNNGDGFVIKIKIGKDKPEWIVPMISSKPLWLLNDRVFGINDMGMLFAISKEDGKILWSYELNEKVKPKSKGGFENRYTYDDVYYSAPVIIDNKILILSSKNQLFLVNPEDGKIIEQKQFKESIFGQPIVNEGKVYVLVNNGNAIVVL